MHDMQSLPAPGAEHNAANFVNEHPKTRPAFPEQEDQHCQKQAENDEPQRECHACHRPFPY